MSQLEGADNYGRPKSDYIAKLASMSAQELFDECYDMIYQSALCANNSRADWHWKADACYTEARRRDDKALIYSRAHRRCTAENT